MSTCVRGCGRLTRRREGERLNLHEVHKVEDEEEDARTLHRELHTLGERTRAINGRWRSGKRPSELCHSAHSPSFSLDF